MSEYNYFFSTVYDWLFFPFLHRLRKNTALIIQQIKPQSVIDLCCGTGNQIKYLLKSELTNVKGIDLSENMIAVAQKKIGNGICQKHNAIQTPFAENSFDVAILSFILHETNEQTAQKIVQEARCITKKSGKIIITDYVFDKKTMLIGKIGAYLIEKMIGGEHYKNFNNYINNNLLDKYSEKLQIVYRKNFLFNSISILVFRNI